MSQILKELFLIARVALFFFTVISGTSVFGQMANNNWIFGNKAGVTFNTNPPSIISGTKISTEEGVATISDENGDLLFYTDGSTVWNSKHQIMPNGVGLSGHISSTQAALITPDPGNCDRYYLFTTDGIENNLANGLQYSIVNMQLNNGLGDIEIKNIKLFSPVAEKMVAILNPAENNIWLVAHEWDSYNYKIYNISKDGVELASTQNIGGYHGGSLINAVGYMKASPNGNIIALINRYVSSVEMLRFDPTTGLLSNYLTLGSNIDRLYGLEFSPDGSNLYIGTSDQIFQFKIDPYIQSNITASKSLIATSQNTIRALQLAPNDKIYVAFNDRSHIGVISSPNSIGSSSGFSEDGIILSGICKFGLPALTIGSSGSPPYFELGNDTTLCSGQALVKDISTSQATYLWQDGSTNPQYTISQPGTYFASVTNGCGVYSDTVIVEYRELISLDLGDDFTICSGETLKLDVTVPYGIYEWHDGSKKPFYLVQKTGYYYVVVSNECQVLRDTIHVVSNHIENLLPPDTILCSGNSITLEILDMYGEIRWQDGTDAPTYVVNSPGDYIVNIENRCGIISDTIEIAYRDLDQIIIPNVFTPNDDGVNDFFEIDERIIGSATKIFNRWGKVVFDSPNYQNDWEAKRFPSGIYYYYITDVCGASYKGRLHILK